MADTLIDDRILTLNQDGPRLHGARCTDCGTYAFPPQDGCGRCTGTSMERTELARRGTLWSWTVQGFPPKSPPYAGNDDPATFEPFGVGYIELPGQIKVEARLTEASPDRLRVGMPMELVLVPLAVDESGNRVMAFAFQPSDEEPR